MTRLHETHKELMGFSYQDQVKGGNYADDSAGDSGYDITAFDMAAGLRSHGWRGNVTRGNPKGKGRMSAAIEPAPAS